MNQKHKLTQESCSSDNYPKNIFSDNYRAKNGSTLKIPSFLPRQLRRWFNNNQLLRCITFRGTQETSSKKLLGRYSSQKVVVLKKPIHAPHLLQHMLTAGESELRNPFRTSQEGGGRPSCPVTPLKCQMTLTPIKCEGPWPVQGYFSTVGMLGDVTRNFSQQLRVRIIRVTFSRC